MKKIKSKKNYGKKSVSVATVLLLTIVAVFVVANPLEKKTEKTLQEKEYDEQQTTNRIRHFGIEIEKIDLKAPVIQNVNGEKADSYNAALEKGLAHFRGTAVPGENNNVFIFGHSFFQNPENEYGKIFSNLGELEKGDEIVVYYRDENFQYFVTDKKIIEESDVSVLLPSPSEQLTLMTCWPIGKTDTRMIVVAHPKNL